MRVFNETSDSIKKKTMGQKNGYEALLIFEFSPLKSVGVEEFDLNISKRKF